MKTDLIEIFQTIRASLQPFAASGYTEHKNSESEYDLWSEKNLIENDKEITERFFVGICIEGRELTLKLNSNATKNDNFKITKLDDNKLKEIETAVAIIHNYFKENDWV